MKDLKADFRQSLQLRALGALDLTGLDRAAAAVVLAQPKRLVLLVYLAAAPHPHFRRRDAIIGLFWPELDESHARGALRQALRFLRQSLGVDVVITRGPEEVGVNRTLLHLDLNAFEQAVADNDPAAALSHYKGELLDGVHVAGVAEEFESWISAERSRIRSIARDCARKAADASRAGGDHAGDVTWARRAYALSEHDERDLARLMQALAAAGDRAEALRLYDDYARELLDFVSALPSTELRAIVQRIRDGAATSLAPLLPVPHAMAASVAASPRAPESLPESHTRRHVGALLGVLLLAGTGFAIRLAALHTQPDIAHDAPVVALAGVPQPRGGALPLPNTSVVAAAAVARGQNYLNKRDSMHIRMARDEFLRAIDADATFADAWIGLSSAYANFAFYAILPSAEAFARSDAAARRAITLKPESGMAHAMLATSLAFQQWRWSEGERALREAIAMDSLQAEPYDLLGNLLRVSGRFDEALMQEKTAARLDPLGRHYEFQAGHVLMCAGRYAEALEIAHAALSPGSAYPNGHFLAAEALESLGRYRESLAELELATGGQILKGHAPPGNDADAQRTLDSLTQHRIADDLRQLERMRPGRFVPPAVRAARYAAAGNWPEALRWLHEGVRVHDVNMKNSSCQTDFWPVREDPRFVAIMKQVGLPADQRGMH